MKMILIVRSLVFAAFLHGVCAQAWTRFDGAVLVPDPRNDGDSFMVRAGDRLLHARLYFVDCPESWDGAPYQKRRIREQARFFGLESADETMRFGKQAAQRTTQLLAEPFTVHTVFHATPGAREIPRYYAVVTLADGRDLAETLVFEGLARVIGVQREMPDGRSTTEMNSELEDFQLAAMMKRNGIWAATDPDRLPILRAERRREKEEDAVYRQSRERTLLGSLDINHADADELTLLPGVGEVMARRIIEHRPFRSIDELVGVPGIGPSTLDRMRPHIRIANGS